MRKLNQQGENQGKVWEGLPGTNGAPALQAYRDSAGKWTIGWGHTSGVSDAKGNVLIRECTIDQAETWFQEDLAPACADVESMVKAPLNDNQFAALVWLRFNIGEPNFKTSTVVRLLNNSPPNYDAVPAAMALFNKVTDPDTKKLVVNKGLVNRRALETVLWLLPDDAMKSTLLSPLTHATPTLTQSDLRQLATSNATPVAPATSAAQTKTGQSALASIATGTVGAVIEGAQRAQQINSSIAGALSGNASSSQWFVIISGVLAAASIGFAVYIYWRTHRVVMGGAK